MRLDGKLAMLPEGPLRSPWSQRTLPSSDLKYELLIPAGVDPRFVAFKLRLEIYVAAGFDEEAVPYAINKR